MSAGLSGSSERLTRCALLARAPLLALVVQFLQQRGGVHHALGQAGGRPVTAGTILARAGLEHLGDGADFDAILQAAIGQTFNDAPDPGEHRFLHLHQGTTLAVGHLRAHLLPSPRAWFTI